MIFLVENLDGLEGEKAFLQTDDPQLHYLGLLALLHQREAMRVEHGNNVKLHEETMQVSRTRFENNGRRSSRLASLAGLLVDLIRYSPDSKSTTILPLSIGEALLVEQLSDPEIVQRALKRARWLSSLHNYLEEADLLNILKLKQGSPLVLDRHGFEKTGFGPHRSLRLDKGEGNLADLKEVHGTEGFPSEATHALVPWPLLSLEEYAKKGLVIDTDHTNPEAFAPTAIGYLAPETGEFIHLTTLDEVLVSRADP